MATTTKLCPSGAIAPDVILRPTAMPAAAHPSKTFAPFSRLLLLLSYLYFAVQLPATAALTRGPYLQCGTPTSIIIRWRTDQPADAVVKYGTDPQALTQQVTASEAKTEQIITLRDLPPDTRYYYSVGNSQTTWASGPDCYFITSPTRPRPIRIWALGDPQYGGASGQAVRDAYQTFTGTRPTDIWLTMGDHGLYTGSEPYFFGPYTDLLRHAVLWPTPGNHDAVQLDGYETGDAPYTHDFSTPTQGEAGGVPSNNPRYYSFDYGPVHAISLNSIGSDLSPMGNDLTTTGAMYKWLEQDLQANTKRWLIVFFHAPPYSHSSHNSDTETSMIQMRANFVPLLEAHGVDLVLTGHGHAYERSFLLDSHYGDSTTVQPSMKLNSGNGCMDGDGPYVKGTSSLTPHQGAVYIEAGVGSEVHDGPIDHPAMRYSARVLGSLVIDVDDNTLHCRFLRETGAIDDDFTIMKGRAAVDFIAQPGVNREGKTEISWTSVPGQIFQISRRDALGSPWKIVAQDIKAASSTTTWQDPTPAPDKAFYRIEN